MMTLKEGREDGEHGRNRTYNLLIKSRSERLAKCCSRLL